MTRTQSPGRTVKLPRAQVPRARQSVLIQLVAIGPVAIRVTRVESPRVTTMVSIGSNPGWVTRSLSVITPSKRSLLRQTDQRVERDRDHVLHCLHHNLTVRVISRHIRIILG